MKVDLVYEKDMLYVYVLSSTGGLLLFLLIFGVLYKVGAPGGNGPLRRLGQGGFTGVRAESTKIRER